VSAFSEVVTSLAGANLRYSWARQIIRRIVP
jgi:hypothetical protein